MEDSNDVITPTAFIMGQVTITGMKGRGYSPDVRIVARSDGHITETQAKDESTYVLLVTPGEWIVSAEVGGAVSDPRKVFLNPGQTLELNFCFGRQH